MGHITGEPMVEKVSYEQMTEKVKFLTIDKVNKTFTIYPTDYQRLFTDGIITTPSERGGPFTIAEASYILLKNELSKGCMLRVTGPLSVETWKQVCAAISIIDDNENEEE